MSDALRLYRKRCPGATFRSGVRTVMLEAFEGFDI